MNAYLQALRDRKRESIKVDGNDTTRVKQEVNPIIPAIPEGVMASGPSDERLLALYSRNRVGNMADKLIEQNPTLSKANAIRQILGHHLNDVH